MRKVAVILVAIVCAALLHTGAMLGVQALTALVSAHPAAHEHGASQLPFCPVGSICPSIQAPSLAFDKLAPLLAVAAAVILVAWLPNAVLAFRHAPFSPNAPPPNHPTLLLSVFKRE